jgi:hypothetical protein
VELTFHPKERALPKKLKLMKLVPTLFTEATSKNHPPPFKRLKKLWEVWLLAIPVEVEGAR